MRIGKYLQVLLLALIAATSAFAWLPCEQQFIFIGKSAGEQAWFYFEEVQAGECESNQLFAIHLGLEKPLVAVTHFREARGIGWREQLFRDSPPEGFDSLSQTDGRYRIDSSASFSAPGPDTAFQKWYDKRKTSIETRPDATLWEKMRKEMIDPPAFEGATTTLVWADPNGFYKNYSIKQALYYRTSGYLVIETFQPIRAGYDEITMHGVMIFSVAPVARP